MPHFGTARFATRRTKRSYIAVLAEQVAEGIALMVAGKIVTRDDALQALSEGADFCGTG